MRLMFAKRTAAHAALDETFGWAPDLGRCGRERILSYLPSSHIAGTILDICAPIGISSLGCEDTYGSGEKGSCAVYFVRPYDMKAGTLKHRMLTCRPTVFMGVPRVYEKMMVAVQQILYQKTKKGCVGSLLGGYLSTLYSYEIFWISTDSHVTAFLLAIVNSKTNVFYATSVRSGAHVARPCKPRNRTNGTM